MLLFHTLKYSFVFLLFQMPLKHCSGNYTTHKAVVIVKFKDNFEIESVDYTCFGNKLMEHFFFLRFFFYSLFDLK